MSSELAVVSAWFHGTRAQSPNDPKLSDRRSWRGLCVVGACLLVGMEAQAVTAEPVRCSAWLGPFDEFIELCQSAHQKPSGRQSFGLLFGAEEVPVIEHFFFPCAFGLAPYLVESSLLPVGEQSPETRNSADQRRLLFAPYEHWLLLGNLAHDGFDVWQNLVSSGSNLCLPLERPVAVLAENVIEEQGDKSSSRAGGKMSKKLRDLLGHFLSGIAGAVVFLIGDRAIKRRRE